MATRRMFSNKIIFSARFIKMPISTQNIYFHLCLAADDDGVSEAFNIMRLVGASEDDLKILVAKNFVRILNDDLVIFIIDWLEHNSIRPDRKVDSVHKHLLMQVVDNVKLIESTPRSDRQPMDNHGTSQGQQMGSVGKDRLGKDRLGKDRIKINKKETSAKASDSSVNEIYNYWNQKTKQSLKGSKPVIAGLETILKDYQVTDIIKVIDYITNSTWHKQNGQMLLSVIAKPTKFAEKLERAQSFKPIRSSHDLSNEDYSNAQKYFAVPINKMPTWGDDDA